MNKFLKYNVDYRIDTFYSEDIHNEIPSECIEITDEVWHELLENSENFKIKSGLSTETVYDNLDDIAYIEARTDLYKVDYPTQNEILFAEYIIATEDRLEAIEAIVNGGN